MNLHIQSVSKLHGTVIGECSLTQNMPKVHIEHRKIIYFRDTIGKKLTFFKSDINKVQNEIAMNKEALTRLPLFDR